MKTIDDFLAGKSDYALSLFWHFVERFRETGNVSLYPAKTMIGIATSQRRIAWITHIGKTFIHVVFPFERPFEDNLCFQKIAKVPGNDHQYNHHFRMLAKEDMNEEVVNFMKLAWELGNNTDS